MPAPKRTFGGVIGGFVGFICLAVVAGLLATAAITPAVAVTGVAASNGIGVFQGLPDYLKIDTLSQTSTMYALKNGKPIAIASFYTQNRINDSWAQISPYLKDAAVATEDPQFYEHGGISVEGTIRAALTNALHKGAVIQGGSSITQQYVKNVRVQTCEQYNVIATPTGKQTYQQAQDAMNKKYQACYDSYTDETTSRKVTEAKMAIGLEKQYSKQQILTGYLNIAGFGGQVYGVEAAARYYFDTTAAKITLPEAATLIAIFNNPENLRLDLQKGDGNYTANNKSNGYAAALDRRNYVLQRMLVNHKITRAQYTAAVKTKIVPHITPPGNGCDAAAKYDAAPYCEAVMNEISIDPTFGKTADDRQALLRRGGLKIYTPLNLNLQQVAQTSLSNYIPPSRPDVDLGGVNVAMELNTGRVVDMVQNRPWGSPTSTDPTQPAEHNATEINYAVDSDLGGSTGFQTGSTYKLFTLLEWLEEGHSINDTIYAPVTEHVYPQTAFHSSCAVGQTAGDPGINPGGTWDVSNDEPGEGGKMSVLYATAQSINTAFAQMGTQLDLCKIRQNALNLGVHLAYPYTLDGTNRPRVLGGSPSAILGVNEVAPITMAAAYAGVANDGVYCQPIYIDRITDPAGKNIPVPKPDCKQVVDKNIAAGAIYDLQGVLRAGGTGASANPNDGVPIMGKTGTTDDAAQNWLVSSTTKVAQATWIGNVQGLYPAGCTDKQVNANTGGCGTATYTNFGNISFTSKTGDVQNGRNVKFAVAEPIIATLNKMYGGASFPTPTGTVLQSKQIQVPNLAGKSVADAKSILTALGFTYVAGNPVDSAQPLGSVADTVPAGGSSYSVGSAITVDTSKGNEVNVPKLAGQSIDSAVGTLRSLGLGATFTAPPTSIVLSTWPKEGVGVLPGSKVKLNAHVAPTKSPTQPPSSPPSKAPGKSGKGNGNKGGNG